MRVGQLGYLGDFVNNTDLADTPEVVGELSGQSHHIVFTDGDNLQRELVSEREGSGDCGLRTSTEKVYL